MKTIINIARNELRQLFYSPIAWGLLVVFFVVAGTEYSATVVRYLKLLAGGGTIGGELTRSFFLHPNGGIFMKIVGYVSLFIPLLAMGMISSEKSSGSNKLLLSSPITHSQVVLGKFVSMMAYCLVLLCSLLVPTVFSAVIIGRFDIWPVLLGFLGVYLLMLTYAAVTIFMSSLTRYQIVAAVGTIAMLFIMNYSRRVGQGIPFVRDITYWLGLSGRSYTFTTGLLTSEDLIYFLAMISLFLCLTVLVLRSSTVNESRGRRVMRFAGVVLATCLVGYVSTRPALMGYYDATRMKTRTLTENSQKVMEMLDGPLTITTYVNLLENNVDVGLPRSYNSDVGRFEHYRRFKPEIKMKYVYYYNHSPNFGYNRAEEYLPLEERAEKWAEAKRTKMRLWKSPEEIDAMIDLSGEGYRLVRIIERGDGSSSRLRMYDDRVKHPTDTEITAALKRLVVKPPKVGFLTGHGERSISSRGDAGYYYFGSYVNFRHALINQGFDVDTVSLSGGRAIPVDIDILVVADPRSEIPAEELAQIESYIASGGSMVAASKPRRREFMEPLLAHLGVGFIPGTLVQENPDRNANVIVGDITSEAAEVSRMYRNYALKEYRIAGADVSGLTYDGGGGFRMYPMVTTDSLATDSTRVWNEMETTGFEDTIPEFNPDAGERLLAEAPVIMGLERTVGERLQRIVVMGDADFISNSGFLTGREGVKTANYAAIMGTFSWITDNEFPVDTDRILGPDKDIRYLTYKDRKWVNPLFNWVIPGIIGLFGLLLLVRRKGK